MSTVELPSVALSSQALFDAWMARYTDPNNYALDPKMPTRRTDMELTYKGRKIKVRQRRVHSHAAVSKALNCWGISHDITPIPRYLRRKMHPVLNGPVTQRKGRRHRKFRKLFEDVLAGTAQKVRVLATRWATELIMQAAHERKPFRFDEISDRVTYEVICEVFGIQEGLRTDASRKLFFEWLDDLMKVKSPFELFGRDDRKVIGFFDTFIDQYLAEEHNTPLTRMLKAKGFSREEIIAQLIFDFISGTVTTTQGICSAIAGLFYLRDSEEGRPKFNKICEAVDSKDRGKSHVAVYNLYQEGLRYAGPSRFRPLMVYWPRRLDGEWFWPGLTMVEVCFASANRDPEHFNKSGEAHPSIFDPERKPNHLAFGVGEKGFQSRGKNKGKRSSESYRCPGEEHSAATAVATLIAVINYLRDWGISQIEFQGELIMRPLLVLVPPQQ